MQGDRQFFRQKAVLPVPNQVGNSYVHAPVAPPFGAPLNSDAMYSTHFHGVEFQPTEVCPKNFIIFDQTDHRSQIMFHPWISNKLNAPGTGATCIEVKEVDQVEREISLPLKEDSDDIDALLSLEEDDGQEYDDEEVSTARTSGDHRSSSPESFSSYYCSKPKKNRFSSSTQKSSSNSDSCNNERKRQKMKKMVRALRGIVPGGNQMNTVAVLDEAVRYLKSLKVEVQNIEVGDSNDV